ncbi:uncharacterized membrane protein (DUF441 family) [Scopulibacillus darangshiensis]|uniref:UPF0756 membrane protein EV207_1629 n=1 Tax=Scopulibacillus darangshiensis TaxID=442528 RepID=A0A4R2NEL6_9BACL|nr:DUF441 domain-containing protein [Scopulibacillus darangshiensis]TCP19504.1 uncharacterized membrane protein (DUF441 family) [Scopulibacillus darangshiensis]
MFTQAALFLAILFLIGLLAKNQSLMIAAALLFVIKVSGLDSKIFPTLQSKGINWGVTIILIAVIVPIASGEIGFKQLVDTVKSLDAWIAIGAGALVALIARGGIDLLSNNPQITIALVLGTILAVGLFKGVPVGPLIGAGIAYFVIQAVHWGQNL